MKIIFINRYFYPDHSATSQILSDLAFFLAASDREVHVITSRQRYDDAVAQLESYEVAQGVHIHRIWTSRFGRAGLIGRGFDYLSFYLSAGWRIWQLARRGDIVVTKTDPPLMSVIVAWVMRRRGVMLVNWLQDLFPEVASGLSVRGMDGAFARFLKRRRNASLLSAKINIAISEGMAQYLRAEGVRPSKYK